MTVMAPNGLWGQPTTQAATPAVNNNATSGWSLPEGLMPTSKSSSTGSSTSNSLSGINWGNPIASAMQPLAIQSGQNIQNVADNMANTLQGQYGNMMRQAMDPNAFQGTLNQLAQRGMINSTTGADAMAQAQNQAAQQVANQGYEAMLAQQAAQFKVPEVIGNLAKLAEESRSTGTSSNASSSLTQDPLKPYELQADMFKWAAST